MAPYILSRAPLRDWLISRGLADTDLHVSTQSARFGWFSPIEIRGIEVHAGENPLLKIPIIHTRKTLLQTMLGGKELGEVRIVEPQVEILVNQGQAYLSAMDSAADEVEWLQRLTDGQERTADVVIDRAKVTIRDVDPAQPQVRLDGLSLRARVEKTSSRRSLEIAPATLIDHFQLSPAVCDAGLKYVTPILAKTTWVQGEASLEFDTCYIDLEDAAHSHVVGRLSIHDVTSGLKNPIVYQIANLVARLLKGQMPTAIRLADESIVDFELKDGRVSHTGLTFGLPEISDELLIRTHGSVGLDETLELIVEIPLPIDLIRDGPLAAALSKQTLKIPIRGTLAEPKVEFPRDGQLMRDVLTTLAGDLTDEAENGEADLAEQLRELGGLLQDGVQELRENRQERLNARPPQRAGRGPFWRLRRLVNPDPAANETSADAEEPTPPESR